MTYGFDEIKLDEESSGTLVTLIFNDTIKKEDYDHFVPQIEKIMESRDKINLLVILKEVKGFTPAAMWADTKFGIRHFDDVKRIAIVGDTTWQQVLTGFAKPFTRADVKYFDHSDLAAAKQWIITK
jgi:hypothetical protein